MFMATGGGCGQIPYAPGTIGSLPGLLLAYLLAGFPPLSAGLATLAFVLLSIWVAHQAAMLLDQKDPGCIVIDEIAGMLITLLALPFTAAYAVAGFLLFRALDIIKPFPIGWLDRRLTGGLGIVLDDVAAGILANAVLRLAGGWLN
jgi:phosphatidylglycerophosphatase A